MAGQRSGMASRPGAPASRRCGRPGGVPAAREAPSAADEWPIFDYFSPGGIRMGLHTAIALEKLSLLRSAHVDACLQPGRTARFLERVAGPRVANRIVRDIPPARIHSHPQLFAAARVWRRLHLSGQDTAAVDRALFQMYSWIARQCISEAVIGPPGASLELFQGRAYRITEQFAAPAPFERAVVAQELARFPGWSPDSVIRPTLRNQRVEAEWQVADLIWVPSHHLIDISRDFGADPRKFRVVPYPIDGLTLGAPARNAERRRGRLRVVFAGTLMLQKGVQYIYEALLRRPRLPVQMDFFGPVNLTPLGVRRLAEVGTVHGPVPRSQLLREFRGADVLLFPSLSEGSALVTLEATALGLPVVATKEAGAPASAMVIPSRSPEAIIDAIEALADDPAQLERLAMAGLAEAAQRTPASYAGSIIDSLSPRGLFIRCATSAGTAA